MTVLDRPLTYYELFTATMLYNMLVDGRRGSTPTFIHSTKESVFIMKTLATNIKNIRNHEDMKTKDNLYIELMGRTTKLCQDFILEVFRQCTFLSIDDFLQQIDSMKNVFQTTVVNQSNENIAPTNCCPGSMFNDFSRLFLLKIDSMTLEAVSEFCATNFNTNSLTTEKCQSDFMTHKDLMSKKCIQIKNLIYSNDVSQAEIRLHEILDSDSLTSSVYSLRTNKPSNELLNTPSSKDRNYQQIMTILATLWTKHKYYNVAYFSIEESMKVSHQRGDKSTIATALLLLHYLFNDDNTCLQNIPIYKQNKTCFDENILHTCVDRCFQSKLRLLMSQTLILLVNLRSQRILAYTKDMMSKPNNITVQILWFVLRSSLFGDINVMYKACNYSCYTYSSHDMGTSGAPNIGSSNQVGTKEDGVLSVNEFYKVYIPNSLASIRLWCRLNKNTLAEFQCRRVLRVYETIQTRFTENIEDIYMISNEHIRLVLDIYCPMDMFVMCHEAISTATSILFAKIYKIIDAMYSNFQTNSLICDKIISLRLYVRLRQNMHFSNIKVALALAKQYENYFDTDITAQENEEKIIVSVEQFESKFLKALCLCHIDPFEGHRCLLVLASYRNSLKFRLFALKAHVYYILSYIQNNNSYSNDNDRGNYCIYINQYPEFMREIKDIKNISVREVYPELEDLITKHFYIQNLFVDE